MVADACRALEVPHTRLVAEEAIAGPSLQRQAREVRYAALTAWAARAGALPLVTAHHADDQAETLLMRLNRASGLAGLAAIRRWRFEGGVLILRPLLSWRRAELAAVVAASGLPHVEDPANTDPRHDRSRIRAGLAAFPDLDAARLARSAGYLADAEDVIGRLTELVWSERWHGADRPFAVADEPRELRRRLIRRALATARHDWSIVLPPMPPSANVESLLDALEAGRPAVQGGILARTTAQGWRFRPAPPRRAS
jgi:tRNA(Ile)-lysidine synthase